MAKKEEFWYVLVMTNGGPKFVTKVNYMDKTAEWNVDEAPKEMNKSTAKDLAIGLMLNFNLAFVVCSPIKVSTHPYNYANWQIEWKEKAPVEAE